MLTLSICQTFALTFALNSSSLALRSALRSAFICARLVVEVFLDLQSCFDFGYDGCYIPTHDLGVVLGEVSIDVCFVVFLHKGNNGCFTVSQFLRNNVNQASFCRINGSTSNQTIEATNTITKQDADRTTQKPDNCTEQATFLGLHPSLNLQNHSVLFQRYDRFHF